MLKKKRIISGFIILSLIVSAGIVFLATDIIHKDQPQSSEESIPVAEEPPKFEFRGDPDAKPASSE